VIDEEPEEVTRLKKEIEVLKTDKIKLSSNLHDLHYSYTSLKMDHEGFVKTHEGKRRYILRIQQDLAVTNDELAMRVHERDASLSTERQWKILYDDVKRDKQVTLEKLLELQARVNDMEQLMKEREERVREEHWQRVEAEAKYQAMITQVEGCIKEHEKTAKHWKTCFSQLAALANGAIGDVPRMLVEADATLFFYKPPKAMEVFI